MMSTLLFPFNKTILFLEKTIGNNINDSVPVEEESDDAYYYLDSLDNWCSISKQNEGTAFIVEQDDYSL